MHSSINILKSDPEVYEILKSEEKREQTTIELIASENFTSVPVLEMAGSVMTNKYAEGYPGKRYYGGCEFVDEIENIANSRLAKLFNARYTNVQPHSGSQANMAVFMSLLKEDDLVVGLDLAHGGHLTHGSKVNFSGKLYNFLSYGVSKDTETVDFDLVNKICKENKPKLIICGGSAYPRFIEFSLFREIADSIGAILMADIAHPSGLIAAGVHPSPFPFCDVVTSTTHKTLRGPRGGIIMMGDNKENPWGIVAPKSGRTKLIGEIIDSMVMPGVQGGPLMHIIGAKAVAFREALKPEFKRYAKNIVKNAKSMVNELLRLDYKLVSGGTDTHVILIDLSNKNITGKKAENILEKSGITVNKNLVPFDLKSPFITSGIRIGTPAITTRGMGEKEMKNIIKWLDTVITNPDDKNIHSNIKQQINELCSEFPIYEH